MLTQHGPDGGNGGEHVSKIRLLRRNESEHGLTKRLMSIAGSGRLPLLAKISPDKTPFLTAERGMEVYLQARSSSHPREWISLVIKLMAARIQIAFKI